MHHRSNTDTTTTTSPLRSTTINQVVNNSNKRPARSLAPTRHHQTHIRIHNTLTVGKEKVVVTPTTVAVVAATRHPPQGGETSSSKLVLWKFVPCTTYHVTYLQYCCARIELEAHLLHAIATSKRVIVRRPQQRETTNSFLKSQPTQASPKTAPQ